MEKWSQKGDRAHQVHVYDGGSVLCVNADNRSIWKRQMGEGWHQIGTDAGAVAGACGWQSL